jgi:DNA polymerase III subunit epsilon
MDIPFSLKRPIIFFDLETTGLDFKYDRIIELGALKIHPDQRKEPLYKKINPGMRISKEITDLTHITNEDVAAAPSFAEMAGEIFDYFKDCDLAGYNILRFDAKVMIEEYKRVGRNFDLESRNVVDVQGIFHQKEKRDLSAAYKFFCDQSLEGAHSASVDTRATYEIFLAQLQRYQDLPHDVTKLAVFSRGDRDRFVDSEGKLFWRDGEAVFNFGKFKSQTLRYVAKHHSDYLKWVLSPERQFSQDVVDICYKATQGEFPVKRSAVAVESDE